MINACSLENIPKQPADVFCSISVMSCKYECDALNIVFSQSKPCPVNEQNKSRRRSVLHALKMLPSSLIGCVVF